MRTDADTALRVVLRLVSRADQELRFWVRGHPDLLLSVCWARADLQRARVRILRLRREALAKARKEGDAARAFAPPLPEGSPRLRTEA